MRASRVGVLSRWVAVVVLLLLWLPLLSACGGKANSVGSSGESSPGSSFGLDDRRLDKATVRVVFPFDFVRHVFYDAEVNTPAKVAADLKAQSEFYSDARAQSNGDVVVMMTKSQHERVVQRDESIIRASEQRFVKSNRDYRYVIGDDQQSVSIWANKYLNPNTYADIAQIVPGMVGVVYYLQGHTGPWQMVISLYNCHSNELVKRFNFYESFNMEYDRLGD
ncbi:hypothetical protein KIM372_06330 [Bombiscardovia nodaiensis]|uniref:Lipoprotein n=1 Tax=Bombiscardovia nodaiensis TaxID=2932181 RepID=A0ABM8B7T4_9BIFI|nr:hypothetical protein KIM372_06330 [Bombiscardovia nodaiensis]